MYVFVCYPISSIDAIVPSMAAVDESYPWFMAPSILDIFLFLIVRIFPVVGALLISLRLSLAMSYRKAGLSAGDD